MKNRANLVDFMGIFIVFVYVVNEICKYVNQ